LRYPAKKRIKQLVTGFIKIILSIGVLFNCLIIEMNKDKHFVALQNMYLAAPINNFYKPRIIVPEGQPEIEIELNENYYHAPGAVHGSVYFKRTDALYAATFRNNLVQIGLYFIKANP